MLTGLHIVFLGGDARHLEIIRSFTDLDANVAVIGFEDLQEQQLRFIADNRGIRRNKYARSMCANAPCIPTEP